MSKHTARLDNYDENFWVNLDKLRRIVTTFSKQLNPQNNSSSADQSAQEGEKVDGSKLKEDVFLSKREENDKQQLLQKIEKIFQEFIQKKENNQLVTLDIPDRKSWQNTNFVPGHGIKMKENPVLRKTGASGSASSRKLMLIQHVLTKIYKLMKTNTYRTKRELFYEDINLFKTQKTIDDILDDIACLLDVPKIQLHVLTTSKGCVAGNLRYKDADENYINCNESSQGILLPNDIVNITYIQSDARFILMVEKSAVFQMLLDSNITSLLHPIILITGKGFPDVNTREMLKKLSDTLAVPVLGLVDADPYGIEILSVYKYGSKAMSFDVESLAVPEMRWLGLLPSDIQRLNLPTTATIPISEIDKKKAKSLLTRPHIRCNTTWIDQIQIMLQASKKAEIEGLSKIDPLFLPAVYLPNKIKYGGWI